MMMTRNIPERKLSSHEFVQRVADDKYAEEVKAHKRLRLFQLQLIQPSQIYPRGQLRSTTKNGSETLLEVCWWLY